MAKEIGAEKRRLPRSSSENEGATDIEINEGVNSSEGSNKTKQQHTDKPNQNETTVTRENEDTAVSPTSVGNNVIPGDGSRQIIAVSANKNPTAFFQLARKFLMTNEMCDLSALEGAIVSAVDAAHLLERSKLASIVRIHTSYVNVEPKRRRQASQQKGDAGLSITTEGVASASTSETNRNVAGAKNSEDSSQTLSSSVPASDVVDSKKTTGLNESQQGVQQPISTSSSSSTARNSAQSSSGGGSRELRRARILVTVKRTESYKRWLEENPTQRQAIIAGTATVTTEDIVGAGSSSNNEDATADLPTKSSSSRD